MAIPAYGVEGAPPHYQPPVDDVHALPENRLFPKICSVIPVIGPLVSTLQQRSLDRKILLTEDKATQISLIHLKNDYKMCSVFSHTVVIISLLAVKFFKFIAPALIAPSFLFYLGSVALVTLDLMMASKNRRLILRIEQEAFPNPIRSY